MSAPASPVREYLASALTGSLVAQRARQAGAWVAIVNPRPSEIDDDAHTVLRGTAAQVLPLLLAP